MEVSTHYSCVLALQFDTCIKKVVVFCSFLQVNSLMSTVQLLL